MNFDDSEMTFQEEQATNLEDNSVFNDEQDTQQDLQIDWNTFPKLESSEITLNEIDENQLVISQEMLTTIHMRSIQIFNSDINNYNTPRKFKKIKEKGIKNTALNIVNKSGFKYEDSRVIFLFRKYFNETIIKSNEYNIVFKALQQIVNNMRKNGFLKNLNITRDDKRNKKLYVYKLELNIEEIEHDLPLFLHSIGKQVDPIDEQN